MGKKCLTKIAIILLILLFTPININAQSDVAELGIKEPILVAPGEVVQIPIYVRNVQDLYGVDFTIEYDPTIIQIEDSVYASPGIQAALGDFLDPGLLLINAADNMAGTYQFVMSQYNPSEPKSGEGIIVLISVKGISEGVSPLTFIAVQMASREGVEIPSRGIDSTVTVQVGVPTQSVLYPTQVSTGLIVVDLSTLTPTPTITATPTATSTPRATLTSDVIKSTSSGRDLVTNKNAEIASNYWLVKNWWIVLVLVLVVSFTGFILWRKLRN